MHVFHMRVLPKKLVSAKDLEDLSVSGNSDISDILFMQLVAYQLLCQFCL